MNITYSFNKYLWTTYYVSKYQVWGIPEANCQVLGIQSRQYGRVQVWTLLILMVESRMAVGDKKS